MEIDYFLIGFIILLLITVILFPISGYVEFRKLRKKFLEGDRSQKVKFYRQNIIWSWVPVILIMVVIAVSGHEPDAIGFKWISIDTVSLSKWIVYPAIVLYLVYLAYTIYSIVILKVNNASRAKAAGSIPEDMKIMLPITKKEKRTWDYLALTAGITEEILYRGYFFFALAVIFPGLSIGYILIISTLLFGIGHVYQGKEAIRSTLLGFFYGLFYIVFNSLIPVIIVHVAQDLIVRNLLDEESSHKNAED